MGHFETEDDIVLVFPRFGITVGEFIKNIKKKTDKRPYTLHHFTSIFRQIASAIFEIQAKGKIHRDISSDNVLIDDDYNIKLIDFGCANKISRGRKTKTGTLMYFAPEIIEGRAHNHKVDVWALGILSYQLLYGVYLFSPKTKGKSEAEIEEEYIQNMMKPIEDFPDDKLLIDEPPA